MKFAAMIAGTHSSVGKTTWALALMALAKEKGLSVQPFKSGPDYIDPSFHSQICAPRKSRNLDLFLLSENEVKNSFARNTADCDIAIVEGMMGLFDGKSITGQEGSSAEIAKLLNLPVFLVLDGSGLATSAAAIVLGFKAYDPSLKLAGVLINRVKSERHFDWLKQAIESKTGVPCLGYLPPDEELKIPERHLGLTTAIEMREKLGKISHAAELLKSRFDWESFLRCTEYRVQRTAKEHTQNAARPTQNELNCRIGVAYDTAFSFYYEDNFDLLRQAGAELIFFSPIQDQKIPADLDLLYFGGGFPEVYAAKLSENQSLIESVQDFYKDGGLIYAECGGFIYLTQAFENLEGKKFPLVGLIPGTIKMADRLQNFGYKELECLTDTFLFEAGQRLRSHEFHYSQWLTDQKSAFVYGIGERREGFWDGQVLASYQHLHFATDPKLVERLIAFCQKRRVG
jgi:cobyrinic acid a,c-diamide synthase